jgi:TonB family protein
MQKCDVRGSTEAPVFSPLRNSSGSESWFRRVAENLQELGTRKTALAVPINASPIHYCSIDLSAHKGNAQTASAIFHVAVCCLALVFLSSTPGGKQFLRKIDIGASASILPYLRPVDTNTLGQPGLGRDSGGGENDPRPTRRGNLAPGSSMPLAPPRLPQNRDTELPVPPAVFDPNAPANVRTVTNLGLPWMDKDTDSAGPGSGHGFGSGHGGGMGDGDGDGAGEGEDGSAYANVVSQPVCSYCPDPEYTEEARKGKLQGIVTAQVLIGADGTAKRIRIVRGLGMGLDERTIETVRHWHFVPARDAHQRGVPVWVTIEVMFRLF